MKRAITRMAVLGLLIGAAAARADTALMFVTPKNIQDGTFRLTSKTAKNNTVEFEIRRDIRGIDGPGRSAYLSHTTADEKGLGTPVKLEEVKDKSLTYRFSVPEEKVAGSVFTLWGNGLFGEGITYRFDLAQFRKPK